MSPLLHKGNVIGTSGPLRRFARRVCHRGLDGPSRRFEPQQRNEGVRQSVNTRGAPLLPWAHTDRPTAGRPPRPRAACRTPACVFTAGRRGNTFLVLRYGSWTHLCPVTEAGMEGWDGIATLSSPAHEAGNCNRLISTTQSGLQQPPYSHAPADPASGDMRGQYCAPPPPPPAPVQRLTAAVQTNLKSGDVISEIPLAFFVVGSAHPHAPR